MKSRKLQPDSSATFEIALAVFLWIGMTAAAASETIAAFAIY